MRQLGLATRALIVGLSQPVVPRAERGRHPKGVAMLIALVTIALLSAAVVEFAYTARVNLSMASNERDRLKSYFLAKSAVNITQLLLSFQVALQKESRATDDDMGQLINRAMRRSNFQIYQYANMLMKPFHSGKLQTPVGGVDLKQSGVEGLVTSQESSKSRSHRRLGVSTSTRSPKETSMETTSSNFAPCSLTPNMMNSLSERIVFKRR